MSESNSETKSHAKESEASPYLLRPIRSLSEYRQAKNAAQTGMEIQKLFGMEVK